MVLADLDDILISASYYTDMRSSSISDVSMEVAVPNYTGLAQALEVEQCRCLPGYQGLSGQVGGHRGGGGGGSRPGTVWMSPAFHSRSLSQSHHVSQFDLIRLMIVDSSTVGQD